MSLAAEIRGHYPLLRDADAKSAIIYLDSAATALRPQCVIDVVVDCMTQKSGAVHRSVHRQGDLATEAYESARQTVADFIGAQEHEIVLLRNTTEALNLVAHGWKEPGRTLVSLGDHHSNLLPWQRDVVRLRPRPDGAIDLVELLRQLSQGDVSLVSVSHISNVLGTVQNISQIAEMCHNHGAVLVVDAAQSAPHLRIDVNELNCDFLAFSGHKLGSPAGIGVLYGKAEHLERVGWYLQGGSTAEEVHAERVVPKEIPWRFEAGTPALEPAVGLAAAIDFLSSFGWERIETHQRMLVERAIKLVNERLPEMAILGHPGAEGRSLLSLVQRIVSPHVLARGLSDRYRVCVRSGFQCAQPLHEFLGVPASLRMSFHHYNTIEEIDYAIDGLSQLLKIAR